MLTGRFDACSNQKRLHDPHRWVARRERSLHDQLRGCCGIERVAVESVYTGDQSLSAPFLCDNLVGVINNYTFLVTMNIGNTETNKFMWQQLQELYQRKFFMAVYVMYCTYW